MELKAVRRSVVLVATAVISSLIMLALWATWTFLVTQSRTATIIDVSGTVLYHNKGGSGWITATPGMRIRAGDQLFTQAPEGVARVVSDDGNIGFQLEPDTLATFTGQWNAVLKTGSGGVYLDHGTLLGETRHEVPDSKTRFIIETKAAKATIVGSRLVVQALRGIPATRISALEGEIRVEAISDQANIIRTDLSAFDEKELVLASAETVIVYIKQPEQISEGFDHNLGRVIDSGTQRGVEGVVMQVVGAPELFALTDKDGYFVIPGNRIFSDLVIAGTTGTTSGDLVIQPFVSRLRDRVIDGITGKVIANAIVTPLEYPYFVAVTGPNGTFEIEGLPVGSHALSVVVDGYVSQVVEARISKDGRSSMDDIHLYKIGVLDKLEFLPLIFNEFFQYP